MASSPDNVITGSNAPDSLDGFDHQNDLIIGYDTVVGDVGVGDNDTIRSFSGEDTAIGGSGDDSIYFHDVDHASIVGGDGNDTVSYTADAFGASTIVAGNGDDSIFISGSSSGMSIDLGEGNDTVHTPASGSVIDGATISGGNGADHLA